ncbi:MAG: hypothetical protein FJ297_06960 [Planctomycetes bacterium]|nr:hypothetical protein [Planctomycetota bacterium]
MAMTRTCLFGMRAAAIAAVVFAGGARHAAFQPPPDGPAPRETRDAPADRPPGEPVAVDAAVQEPRAEPPRAEPPREGAVDEPRTDRSPRDSFPMMRELQARIRALESRVAAARERGEPADEANHMLDELRQRLRAAGQEAARRGFRPFGEGAERFLERMRNRVKELRGNAERAAHSGHNEEAERLAREAEEVERQILEMEREGTFAPGLTEPRLHDAGARPHEEREAHLIAAIENLRAAGLHDHAARLEQELRTTDEGRHADRGPRLEPPHGLVDEPKAPGDPMPVIQELRAEIDRMRREMAEMRQFIHERLESREPRRDRGEGGFERDQPERDQPERDGADNAAKDHPDRPREGR